MSVGRLCDKERGGDGNTQGVDEQYLIDSNIFFVFVLSNKDGFKSCTSFFKSFFFQNTLNNLKTTVHTHT